MSSYRLPPDLRADLEWYWCRADADLGVHSNMSATIARANLLAHGKHKPANDEDRPSGIRLALAKRHKARDEELRLFMLFGTPKLDQVHAGELMPDRAERARKKLREIHAVLKRLDNGPNGREHVRVLFWVYGDPSQDLEKDELRPIAKFIKTRTRADEMLGAASHAYADAHEVEKQLRKRERRERFRMQLGAA